jgi:hypothetical protein
MHDLGLPICHIDALLWLCYARIMKTTIQERVQVLLASYQDVLREAGIQEKFLAKKLKAELKAKITQRVKVRGAVDPASLPKGRKLIATSGVVTQGEDGRAYVDGDSVIEWQEVAWKIQQQARMDAQKLLGCYPAEKHEHSGEVTMISQAPEPKPLPDHFKPEADD